MTPQLPRRPLAMIEGKAIAIPQGSSASHKAEKSSVRGSSLPRIDVIEDEMDISVGNR